MATTKNITMKQFNGTDYDTLYPKTIYNQVSGVAPAGYGLGGIGKRVTDMNNAQESGFYSALGASNLPPNVESVQYGSVLVLCSQADRVTQVYFQDVTDGTGAIAVRRLNGNGWSPWEFINPPMQLGVEYRTTERYLGKPVYALCANFGANIDGSSMYFGENVLRIVRGQAYSGQGDGLYPWYQGKTINNWSAFFDFVVGTDTSDNIKKVKVTCRANSSASNTYSATYVVLHYTKSTD